MRCIRLFSQPITASPLFVARFCRYRLRPSAPYVSFSTVPSSSTTPPPPAARTSNMPHSDVTLTTILERFKANELHILATTTKATTNATTTTSPPSPPLSPTTRPATFTQLTAAPRAAVLVGLFTHPTTNQVNVLLTLRANTMTSHQGEVALPGGRQDEADSGDDVRTALREAEEEVGLDRSLAAPCARLRRVFSKKGLLVSSIVAAIPVPSYLLTSPSSSSSSPPASFVPHLSGSEVAVAFCLPLHTFLSSVDYRYEERMYDVYTYRMHFFTRRTSQWIEVDSEPPLPPTTTTTTTAAAGSGGSEMCNWRVGGYEREFVVWGMTASVLVAAAKVAYATVAEFAVPPLTTAKRGEQPTSTAASMVVSEEGTVSQSNL